MKLKEFETYLEKLKITRSVNRGLVIHHTDIQTSEWKGSRTVEGIRKYHKSKGWKDIGYHFIFGPDGTIWKGRDVNLQGAHCDGNLGNYKTIGVAFCADFTHERPADLYLSPGIKAVALLLKKIGVDKDSIRENVHFHRDWDSTSCPGTNLDYDWFVHRIYEVMDD